jgi:O-antigen biosynthesis protein WbqV
MGEPVRIDDLARQMIRLAGCEPERDIEITYTGLRPGEKLHEELWYAHEELTATGHPGIMAAVSDDEPPAELASRILRLEAIAANGAALEDITGVLREVVPAFRPAAAGAAPLRGPKTTAGSGPRKPRRPSEILESVPS